MLIVAAVFAGPAALLPVRIVGPESLRWEALTLDQGTVAGPAPAVG